MPKSMDRNFDKKAGNQRTLSSRCVSSDDPRLKSKQVTGSLHFYAGTRFRSGNFHDADDGVYLSGGNTIGSGGWEAGQGRLCFAAISPMTRSQRSFPKLL